MTTINPYFDPILGKLRNSDLALLSLASITDPFIVNNLQVLSNTSLNTTYTNILYASTVSTGNLISNTIANNSTVSTNLLSTNGLVASLASFTEIHSQKLFSSTATLGLTHISTIDWNLTSGATALVEGQMNWDANQQTAVIGMAGGNVDLALGMETLFPRRVRNSTGSTMAKGTVVYINGVSGNTPTVERAIATADMSSAFTLGMTAEDIGNGATGWVATFGELTGINLSAYTGGDTLYLSGATAGLFTNVPQLAPKHYVRVGTVVKATTDGALVVNVINGYELNELHNVAITSLASGQILQSGASNLWYNVNPAFIPTASYPSLGSLAILNSLSYFALDSKPSLGSLAPLNSLSYYALDSRLSLGSLAVQDSFNFYNLVSYPSLGSLSVLNSLSYYGLDSRLSLGSLAVQNTVDYINQVTSKPSLGSLAPLNSLSYYALDSRLSLGSLAVQNTISYDNLVSLPSLNSNYLRLDLTNTPLSGATLNFDNANNKNININRTTTASTPGRSLNITSGGAVSGGTNQAGGNLQLSGGISTGNNGSDITFLTATPGTSGTTDRTPTEKVRIKGSGNVGIGTTVPAYKLDISGTIRSTGDAYFDGNIISTSVTNGYFGDGTDGAVSFDAFNRYPEFETFDSANSTYTLTRDIYASGITVGSGIIVKTGGYRIFCNGILSNSGSIINDGTNASGTTAGVGGAGGFFKAGTNGVAGLGTGSVGAVGTTPSTVTNLVGGIGGRGGAGYATQTTFRGTGITSANAAKPTSATGGSKLVSNLANYFISFIPSGAASNFQFTPSSGGGSGAKSATGTTATSGAGGGGGGVVFIASKTIINSGTISANGGNGSDATAGVGNTANIGAGGGGGGGIVAIVTSNFQTQTFGYIVANGGFGGYGVDGTNATRAVAVSGSGTTGTTSGLVTFTPTEVLNKQSIYMVSVILVGTSVSVQNLYIPNFVLTEVANVDFSTIASPGRRLALYMATWDNNPNELTQIDNQIVELEIAGTPTSCRFIIDEIQNGDTFASPLYAGFATNRSDSTTNITTDLGYVPTTGNMVYSVFARVGGTTPVVGTGNTVVSNYNTAPFLYTSVSLNRQTNNHTWTTASAAAAISVDLPQPAITWYNASNGWAGKVLYFKV